MKSIVICGSKRFKAEAREFARKIKELGVLVYEPYFHQGQEEWDRLSDDYKKFISLGLTHDHFYKIRMADAVYFYNQDGYLGNSSTLELGFAEALGKPIYALMQDKDEPCRNVLFDEIVSTPEELVKRLQ